jgi:hypothetical protein
VPKAECSTSRRSRTPTSFSSAPSVSHDEGRIETPGHNDASQTNIRPLAQPKSTDASVALFPEHWLDVRPREGARAVLRIDASGTLPSVRRPQRTGTRRQPKKRKVASSPARRVFSLATRPKNRCATHVPRAFCAPDDSCKRPFGEAAEDPQGLCPGSSHRRSGRVGTAHPHGRARFAEPRRAARTSLSRSGR